jgi:hypothetical protein
MDLRKIIMGLSIIGLSSLVLCLTYVGGLFHNVVGVLYCLLLINIAINWRYDYILFGGRLLLVLFGGVNILLIGVINILDLINIGIIDLRIIFSGIVLLIGYGVVIFSILLGDARFGHYLVVKSFVGDIFGKIIYYLSWVILVILFYIIWLKMV